jgi:hypothetical protein
MLHVRHRALCLVQSTRMAMAAHAAVAVAAQAQASDDALPGRILVYDLRLLRHISLRLGLCSDCGTLTLGSLCPVLPVLRLFFLAFPCPSFLFLSISLRSALIHTVITSSVPVCCLSLISGPSYSVLYTSKSVGMHSRSHRVHTKRNAHCPDAQSSSSTALDVPGARSRLLPGRCQLVVFIGQRTRHFHDEWLSGRPLWGLHPLRGQCRNRWGSIWGRHFSTVHRGAYLALNNSVQAL